MKQLSSPVKTNSVVSQGRNMLVLSPLTYTAHIDTHMHAYTAYCYMMLHVYMYMYIYICTYIRVSSLCNACVDGDLSKKSL